jgi:hypothetical protein
VKQLRRLRLHQRGGNCPNVGIEYDLPELGNALPVAIVVEESTGFVSRSVLCSEWAWLRHIPFDASCDQINPVHEQPANDRRAISLEFVYAFLVDVDLVSVLAERLVLGAHKKRDYCRTPAKNDRKSQDLLHNEISVANAFRL